MVVRLVIGGRSLTDEEVLFRHQLLKLIQKEKLKRSLHRTFVPGKVFGSSDSFKFGAGRPAPPPGNAAAAGPQLVSNPLYNSAQSPQREPDSGSARPSLALAGSGGAGPDEEVCGAGRTALSEQAPLRSKAGRTSSSLLQLMKQSHGSLKQLFSKEGMAEEGAGADKDGALGTLNGGKRSGRRARNLSGSYQYVTKEEALVLDELRKDEYRDMKVSPSGKSTRFFTLEKESGRLVSVVCTDDPKDAKIASPAAGKVLPRGSSPQRSGKVSPEVNGAEAHSPAVEAGADVSLREDASFGVSSNSPRVSEGKASRFNSPREGKASRLNSPREGKASSKQPSNPASPVMPCLPDLNLYADDNLKVASEFAEISLKYGIVSSKSHRYVVQEESTHYESVTVKEVVLAKEVIISKEVSISGTSKLQSLREQESPVLGGNSKSKSLASTPTSNSSKHNAIKGGSSSGHEDFSMEEPLSQQSPADASDSFKEKQVTDKQQYDGRSKSRGRRRKKGSTRVTKSKHQPFKKLFTSTILCRCDLDSIS